MKLYYECKDYKLYEGNMLDMLEVIEPETIDSIITDPPYELNFMGKGWDNAGVSFQPDTWKKCFEVLKPGGYLLAFGGSRTFHRIAVAIEDAGFEIRDTIMWLYGSGFPKSLNIGLAIDKKNGVDNRTGIIKTDGKATNSGSGCYNWNNGKYNSMKQQYQERIAQNEWQGWGTTLKPSFEPIIVARKPIEGTVAKNCLKYGVGGINIDECRVGNETHKVNINDFSNQHGNKYGNGEPIAKLGEKEITGRFPANTILTYDEKDIDTSTWVRYFYCAKASKKDRDEGLEEFEEKLPACMTDFRPTLLTNPENWNNGEPVDYAMMRTKPRKNIHPTVKPTELMQYLIRLVNPDGATILDPFNGSGSTGKAVMYENKERNKNYKYIGIEITDEYLPISKSRIDYARGGDFGDNYNSDDS